MVRKLLRTLRRLIKPDRAWSEHVKRVARAMDVKDNSQAQSIGDNYAFLLEAVHQRQALLKSHNIGIPVEIREREMNQKAARLVGLQLPPKG